ncbi:MAG: iron-sulfur cluster assembly scaffold protein [Thermomicrobiales bacterium]|nr:iron-sulfur cluster assembly scaffold protein [Thermomicrobiales bacterium]
MPPATSPDRGENPLDRQAYIDNILDHYEHPRNKHRMEHPSIQLGGGNPGCGDLITLYLKISDDGRIEEVSYEGDGCTISQAGGSIIAELIEGMTLDEVSALGTHTMIEEMGEETVKSRVRCATLALGTAQAAVKAYRDGQRTESASTFEN